MISMFKDWDKTVKPVFRLQDGDGNRLIEEEDKFVLIYALFKLKLVHGKTIVFVNSVDRCYKLKLYLDKTQLLRTTNRQQLAGNG